MVIPTQAWPYAAAVEVAEPHPGAGRPWRGRSPQQRGAERRRRLLDAGLQLFGTQGYAATSLTALCATAGVSPRHFYEVFADREDLLRAVYDELVEENARRALAAVTRAELEVGPQVEAGLRAVVAFLTEDPRRARVVQLEVVGVSPALEQHRRDVVESFAELLAQRHRLLVAAGHVPPQPFDLIAVALVGAINEVLANWLLRDPRPAADDLLPPLARLFASAFR